MKTVLVLGAAGRVGEAVAEAFLARGWRVRGGVRGRHLDSLAAGVVLVELDAFDGEALARAAEGAEIVVNALNPLYTEWEEKVMPMARNVAAAAREAGAVHMLPGNVYNFGHGVREHMAENMADMPSTAKARIRIELEALFREETERGGRTVVIRAGDFYGGRRPGTWLDELILKRLRSGVFTWPGPAHIPHAFAYLPDLAAAFVAVAERARGLTPFETFHFAGHTLSGNEMKRLVEEATGRRLAMRGVPWPLLRVAGLFSPMLKELAAMSYLWRVPHSLDGSKLARLVPELAATPPDQAVVRAIRDLGIDAPNPVARLAA